MKRLYPLTLIIHRHLGRYYDGPVCIWDIDKTYLSTGFSSARGLARIPVELAIDKQAIAGMPEVLRALRFGPTPKYEGVPIYFVSASPPQLRRVLEHKMLLDGVEYDGIIFKDWMGVLRSLRPGRLRQQVGFKLCALLTGRILRPMATEYLFGDDAEADPYAFALYGKLLQQHRDVDAARALLREAGVAKYDAACVLALLKQLDEDVGKLGAIFIHLEHNTTPEETAAVDPLIVPVRGGFQLSLALLQRGLVNEKAVHKALVAHQKQRGHGAPTAVDLVQDAIQRGIVEQARVTSTLPAGVHV